MKWVIAVLAVMSAPAMAGETSQPLWGGINYGMDGAEARALYPKLQVDLTPECRSNVGFNVDDKRAVTTVWIGQGGRWTRECGVIALEGLRAKYGEPTETREPTDISYKWGTASYRWEHDGLLIKMSLAKIDAAAGIKHGDWEVRYERLAAVTGMASKL